MDLKETWCGGVDWIYLARDQWRLSASQEGLCSVELVIIICQNRRLTNYDSCLSILTKIIRLLCGVRELGQVDSELA
jgi:hypothetical protein